MSDDPFEVKLSENNELLEDEYKESQKRRTMLDAKVIRLIFDSLYNADMLHLLYFDKGFFADFNVFFLIKMYICYMPLIRYKNSASPIYSYPLEK